MGQYRPICSAGELENVVSRSLTAQLDALQGAAPLRVRLETIALGLFGILAVNVARIALIAVVAYLFGPRE